MKRSTRRWPMALVLFVLSLSTGWYAWQVSGAKRIEPGVAGLAWKATLRFNGPVERRVTLREGETIELAVGLPQPSLLPTHGRVAVTWTLADGQAGPSAGARQIDAYGIYTAPTANWRKVLHALDPDLYLVYRAPVAGEYRLEIAPVTDEPTVFEGARWRDEGSAPTVTVFPRQTLWPAGLSLPLTVELAPIDLAGSAAAGMHVEQEPNDTPELGQRIDLPIGEGIQALRISGGADDIEYFDNGAVGRSGDDWFQLVYNGREPRLLTVDLTLPDHTLAAQVRMYALEGKPEQLTSGWPRPLLPIVEYTAGRNENERVHQQNEGHRAAIVRLIKPGGVYFLRAEANAPGYEVELRVLPPAPYRDPRLAVRQAMYDHIGQVDSWLSNRPRGASVERRIRDTGNLMGTHCMSCHTQSGVWGPVVPVENGYRVENIQHYRRMVNMMYESLRPTNYLKEAANNTSLPPLDIGDGPAGTRVTGRAAVTVERIMAPRKLHSKQVYRAANLVLQTADPSGINAAGPGSNVGQSVVYAYAGEILRRAWDQTGHPRYLAAIEEKATKLLAVVPRYSDDMSHRIEFFRRFFPADYQEQNRRAHAKQKTLPPEPPLQLNPPAAKPNPDGTPAPPPPARFPDYKLLSEDEAARLLTRIREQLALDEARLRAIQNPDGTWGFDPGKSADSARPSSWKTDGQSDPAPTALALLALEAMGAKADDPAVARGVEALLRHQDPYGRWNKAAQTGFVTTSYALHALARLYPVNDQPVIPAAGTTLTSQIARMRAISHTADRQYLDEMIRGVAHPSPWVRTWAVMALGAIHDARGVPALIRALGDRTKMVRDAAAWAMEQTLLDDQGFSQLFLAFERGDDLTRETALKALAMRADAVLTRPGFAMARLTTTFDRALNDDRHPGVRAWAARAAWQWWVWNPTARAGIQAAWTRKLLTPEPNALVENCFRYQSQALFIANGHKANASEEHQYKELSDLFRTIEAKLDSPALPAAVRDRLARRLVAVAATYYNTSGGDGGPGQMGYITPGSANLFGKAAFHLWNRTGASDLAGIRLVLEGAAGVGYTPLQDRVINYSTNGPEALRTIAAAAVSDPSTVTLPATEEKVGPLVEQIHRGAQDYDRRQTLAAPVMRLLARANWAVPKTTEQRQILYNLLVPKFNPQPDAAEVGQILQAAADSVKPMGQQNPDWYLSDKMGATLAANPDLHTEVLLRYLPGTVSNPLIGHFWLPSLRWVMEYGDGVPEVDASSPAAIPAEIAAARDQAITLYLEMLRPEAPWMTRTLALRLANQTAIRRLPRVRDALARLVETEKDNGLANAARNVLRTTDPQRFLADLREAAKSEPLAAPLRDSNGEPQFSPAFLASFRYFNDHVAPELNRPQRMDEMSCLRCHGVKGRVPSMELEPADNNGYWPMPKMLRNYLILQQRVNLVDIETSKLLRKPLNIQTGKEDGHQGGRRYTPGERGYQIIRRWVLDQPRVLAAR